MYLDPEFMIRKTLLACTGLLSLAFPTQAQKYFGVATGDYLPTKSVYLNPALIAHSKLKWSVDVFSVNADVNQNYGTINTNGIVKTISEGNINLNAIDKMITKKGNKSQLDLMGGLDVNVLNAYVSLKNKHHLGFNYRVRTIANLHDYDPSLISGLLGASALDVNNMRINMNSWSELGISYASQLWQNEKYTFAVGGTVKYLGGLNYMGANIKSVKGTVTADPNSNNKGNINADAINLNASVSSGTGADFGSNILNRAKAIFDGTASGIGADLGITFEIKKVPAVAKGKKNNIVEPTTGYKWRFSAAVMDLGMMNYKNTTNLAANGSGVLSVDSVTDNYNEISDLRNYLDRSGVSTEYENKTGKQRIATPASIVLGADYNVDDKFFVNANFIYGFVPGNNSYSPMTATQLTVTPRFENNLVTFGLPLTYNFFTESFKAGLGIRVSGLYLGTDDALALLGSKNSKGFNVYCGAQIPIAKKKGNSKNSK